MFETSLNDVLVYVDTFARSDVGDSCHPHAQGRTPLPKWTHTHNFSLPKCTIENAWSGVTLKKAYNGSQLKLYV